MGGRRALLAGAVAALLAAVAWWGVRARPPAVRDAPAAAPAPRATIAAASGAGARPADPRQPPQPPPPGGADVAAGDEIDELDGDAIAAGWANVDLAEVRRALPDNRYWQMGAPTTDEAETERRARERDRWNVEYGKVLSGTGSEEEVRAYYDERARVSGDYVELSTYLLDHYGEVLHPRDVSLLQLARRMHLSRLEEIPRELERALQRKTQQDEARARWQADERAFNGDDAAPPAGDE